MSRCRQHSQKVGVNGFDACILENAADLLQNDTIKYKTVVELRGGCGCTEEDR